MARARCTDFLAGLLVWSIVLGGGLLVSAGCRAPGRVGLPEELFESEDITKHSAPHRSFDHRPYEFIWADREPETEHLADFERLLGWRIESADDVDATLERGQEVQLWGEYVGLLKFESPVSNGWVRLIPIQPIRLHDPADTATLWLHQPQEQPEEVLRSRLALVVKDTKGEEHIVDFGPLWQPGWRLLYARWPAELRTSAAYPIEIKGLKWFELPPGAGTIHLDALSLFVDATEPVRYPRRPRRPVALRDGQLEGINQGEGELAFPSKATTVIPVGDTNDVSNRLEIEETEAHVFTIERADAPNPAFRVHAGEGLERILVLWDGTIVGEVSFALAGMDYEAGRPVVVRKEAERLYLEFARGDILRFAMQEQTLVVDVHFRGRVVSTWRMALTEGDGPLDWLAVPYLTNGAAGSPLLAVTELEDQPVFLHLSIDPYRSNASRLEWCEEGRQVSAIYDPVTDGRRNDAHERFILTAAPQIGQVLPKIPNPPGERRDELSRRIVLQSAQPTSLQARLQEFIGAEQAGLGAFLYLAGEEIWRQQDESRSFRKRANPHAGGDSVLKEFIRGVAERTEGRVALYTHPAELSPLNAAWSRNALLLQSDATWRPAGPWAFTPRPVFSLLWWLDHLDTVHERFAPGAYWMDGITADPPWAFTDYDRRVTGAGTFSQALFAFGDLFDSLSNGTAVPLLGDARTVQFYGGLLDGVLTREHIAWRPYNPYHKLHRIQPLTVTYGPPLTARDNEKTSAYIANQLAYGNALALAWAIPMDVQQWRAIYTMRPLQELYTTSSPSRLMYSDGDQYLRASEALGSGLWQRSWLYTQYGDDLELWVNGHAEEPWTVQAGGRSYRLPPSGWLARGPDVFAFSGVFDEVRVEVVRSAQALFVFDEDGEFDWDVLATLLDDELPPVDQWEWMAEDQAAVWRPEP